MLINSVSFDVPLIVEIPRKTKENRTFALNLNIYRNTHHMILNKAKILYREKIADIVRDLLFPDPPYQFCYTIFPASKRAFDLGNVGSIIQKFTDDSLIELGIIPDDNFKIISEVLYRFGGVDKDNPHAELKITKVNALPAISR